ncbi:hypothetical protein J6590_101473 [Homalodisca vitripennis]|nr:hypothetical protein J6590_101473 [Homalodisca vitripennis]
MFLKCNTLSNLKNTYTEQRICSPLIIASHEIVHQIKRLLGDEFGSCRYVWRQSTLPENVKNSADVTVKSVRERDFEASAVGGRAQYACIKYRRKCATFVESR